MSAVAIVQARMGSSRLPGKILADLGGRPLLLRVVERARLAGTVGRVAVATSDGPADDPVEELCTRAGIPFFRGSEQDVLDRYYKAARHFGADPVVRITADCPLLDPAVVDRVVAGLSGGGWDYASNALKRTFPDGLDAEAFTFGALECAWREARLKSEREHVTPYIWKQPDKFRLHSVEQEEDLSALRWTVDEPADLEFVRGVHAYLGEGETSMGAVLRVLADHPELSALNAGIEMNEGYAKSLRDDSEIP